MTDAEKKLLTAERDAIKKRIDAAPNEAAKAHARQNCGERLAHLEDRLQADAPPPSPSPEPPASS